MKKIGLCNVLTVIGFAFTAGCNSNDTSGSGIDETTFQDEVFVSGDSTTGTISLEVNEDELSIGETSGFHVYVKNASGQPVAETSIACDTEQGLALIEPTTGFELTDTGGQMSGRVGCESPGSLQLMCRLNVGTNRRAFHTLKCRGDIPTGFQGFPGAGGGGIGGGVQVNDDGDVRIAAIGFSDKGEFSSDVDPDASIDTVQSSDCSGDGPPPDGANDPEPFYDTYVVIKVENNSNDVVRFNTMSYSVNNVDGNGDTFTSRPLGITQENGSTLNSQGDVGTIVVPIFKALGGQKYVGDPSTNGRVIEISGFRTVRITLKGETGAGESVTVTGTAPASFSDFDNCSGG